MKRFILIVLLLFSTYAYLLAQITHADLLTKTPRCYERAEWTINLVESWQNPYLQEDLSLDMLIIAPSGKQLLLPCYYESGESGSASVWKARFTPQETGKYSYYFRLINAQSSSISPTASFYAEKPVKNGFLHKRDNWTLQFDDHKPFRGIGENLAWESRANDDSKFFKELHQNSKYNYEYMLRSLAKHGGNFYRTWICPWNLPIDWKNPVNTNRYSGTTAYYNPDAILKMDRLVTLSDSLGVYMMLTLGEGAGRIKDGGFAVSNADFFVNPQSKARYKNRLRYIIARWGYSTSIAAWELFNEVDNVQFANKDKPISADTIVQWHKEMSEYIKAIDPYGHLVTTSISHRDLQGLNSLQAIDFNQKHIYKNTAGIPLAIADYEQKFDKPYVIGEYGYEWDWSKNFDDFAGVMDSDFKRGLCYGLFSPTPILPMSWWWEYFDSRGTDAYILKIRNISDQMMAAGKGSFEQVPVSVSSPGIITYGVKCGQTVFVYAYNSADSGKNFNADITTNFKAQYTTEIYDCESGKYKQGGKPIIAAGKLHLAGIALKPNTDVIFVIKQTEKR